MKKLFSLIILSLLIVMAFSGFVYAKKSLNVWIMDPGSPAIQKFIEESNEEFESLNPEVDVEITWIPWTSAHQKFMTSIAGGVAPDVAEMGTTWTPEFAQMGALADAGEYINQWTNIKDDLLQSLIDSGTYKDTTYGIPWYAGCRALYYRKDIFEEEGLKPPKTWDELIEVSKKVQKDTDNDGDIDRYALAFYARSEHEWLPFVWQNGGKLAVKDEDGNWVSKMDSPEAVEAMKFYSDLYTKYNFMPEGAVSWKLQDCRQAFAMGKAAMFIGGSWEKSILIDMNEEVKGNLGVTLYPKKKQTASFAGGSHLVVFKQSENKDAGFKYVKFLLGKQKQLKWAKLANFFPGRVSLYDDPHFKNDPLLKVFAEQLKHSKAYPSTPLWGMVEKQNLIRNAMQNIFMGEDANKVAEDLTNKMNTIFKSY